MSYLELIRAGATYSLDDGTYCYYRGDDGLGMPAQEEKVERGPEQDGDTHKGFRLSPREFRLYLELDASSRDDLDLKRQTLLRLFPPGYQVSLRFNLGHGIRQIDCRYQADMDMPSSDRRTFGQLVVVTLKANIPTFYNPTPRSLSFQGGSGGTGFIVPMVVPHEVATSGIDLTKTIDYAGDWRAYPRILIRGPITDPRLENVTMGHVLDFDGHTIAAGDWYEIDLRYGSKTIVDQDGVKVEPASASDPSNFHIAPDPYATDGQNIIAVSGSGATSATYFDIYWLDRFMGK